MPEVSVIIPVYNSGRFLEPTVASVLAQTIKDFEVLLVDDGSRDGSGKLCDDLAAREPRIRVFHRANSGICATRNFAMKQARGAYVAFCDHDDFCEPTWLERMLRAAKESGCPIAKCDHSTEQRFPDGTKKMLRKGMADRAEMKGDVFRPKELVTPKNWNVLNVLTTSIWDCLFERSFLESHGLTFDESFRTGGEDMMFMRQAAAVAAGIAWCPEVLYRHYENVGTSTSASYHANIPDDFLRIVKIERILFPPTARVAHLRFKRWMVRLWKYAYGLEGCPLCRREKARVVQAYFDEVTRDLARGSLRGLGVRDRFAAFVLRHGMAGLYVWAREGGHLK